MYTIISYRENGQVFRGGYCEGRTDSDFSIQTTRSGSDAIEFLAQAIYLDKVAQNRDLNKDYDFTEAAEITPGINGYFGNGDVMVGSVLFDNAEGLEVIRDKLADAIAQLRQGGAA